MPFIKLNFKPGLNRDQTNYSNEGGWFECNKIRFRSGYPEKLGGWVRASLSPLIGTCRQMFGWVTSFGDNLLALGTDAKVYIEVGGNLEDITPIRETTTAGDVTFSAVDGSNVITVTDVGSDGRQGGYVTFSGALTLSGGLSTGTIAGTSTGSATFTTVSQDSTSGGGYGAEFTITADGAGGYTLDAITAAGNAYAVSDTLVILGTDLGGTSPANNATITVTAVTSGNITAAILNTEHEIATNINSDAYTIVVSVNANAFDTGNGGAATIGEYQLNPGFPNTTYGYGWNTGTWGRSTWGSGSTQPVNFGQRTWFFDNFDNDLIMNYYEDGKGPIYIWERGSNVDPDSAFATRAVLLSSLVGASAVPVAAGQILVSQNDKHLLAFGAVPFGSTNVNDFDPLLIRWADQDNPENWTPSPTNSAGFIRVSRGDAIVRALATRQEILVYTNTGLSTLQYTGTTEVFALQELSDNISVMSPRCFAIANNMVYWMGYDKFYVYSGRVDTLPTSLWSHVFRNFNYDRSDNVVAGTNEGFNEIWWFYASAQSNDNDSYVIYNYVEKIWYYGTIERTAWLDSGLRDLPQAIGSDKYLYNHESGVNDGTTAMNSYILSSDFDLGDGENFMLTRRIIPDVKFDGSTANTPEVEITLVPKRFPGASPQSEPNLRVIQTSANIFTNEVFIRGRGRSMAFKIMSDDLGVNWQLGSPLLDARPDGKR